MAGTTTREGVEEVKRDVTTNSEQEPAPRDEQKTLRQETMDSIYARRREQVMAGAVPADAEEEQEEDSKARPPKTHKVKVYGEEKEIPEEEIIQAGIRTYQKETAADARLREAAERQRQLEAREAELAERERRLQERKPEQKADLDDGSLDSIVNGLYEGEDSAKEAIKEIITRAQRGEGRTLSEAEVGRMVQQEVDRREAARRQEEIGRQTEEADKWFSDTYGWIEQDPDFMAYAYAQLPKIQSEHPEYGPRDLVEAVGKKTEEFVSKLKGGQQRDSLAAKREAKRHSDIPPAASGRAPSPPESTPKTKRDAFLDIRRARGQSV